MISISEQSNLSSTAPSKIDAMSQWVSCMIRVSSLVSCELIYYLGIRKTSMEEWIRIDKNYLDRITLRKQLLNDHPEICMGNSNISNPAIRELYEEILLDLLPKRYPSIFRISGDIFFNLVTGSRHRISAALADHAAMLRHLGENVEEDFVFMVPNPHSEFVLEGFVACFPQGFLPAAKLGMSVSEIHKPVPGYEGRLKKGVNRCFERMERGQSIGRLNVRFIIIFRNNESMG